MSEAGFAMRHFELLERWGGQPWSRSPEQQRAYDEIAAARDLTTLWAERLQRRLFPDGMTEGRQTIITQGQRFQPYTWRRIYPRSDAPRNLAYTVGIDASSGFVAKLDTYQPSPALVRAYDAMCGSSFEASPCVHLMTAEEGCALSLDQLVEWAEQSILGLGMAYEQAEQVLDLVPQTFWPLDDVEEVHGWMARWREMMLEGVSGPAGRVRIADVGLVMDVSSLPNDHVGASLGTDPTGRRWVVEINEPTRARDHNSLATVARDKTGKVFLLRQGLLKASGEADAPTSSLARLAGLEPIHAGFGGRGALRLWYVVCDLEGEAHRVRSSTAAFVAACEMARGWAPAVASALPTVRLTADERGGSFVVGARTHEEVIRDRAHGSIYLALKEALLTRHHVVEKLRHSSGYEADLVVRRANGSTALVEIKTSMSASDVHTGVGQLFIYRQLMQLVDADLWLLLPDHPSPYLARALIALGVEIITCSVVSTPSGVEVAIPDETIDRLREGRRG